MEKFRTLRADEIDVRVGTKKEGKGASFLLYKDARCDMAILDETLTPFGWQREHKQIKDVVYCGVSLKDPATGEWLTKWDAGSESNTEAEKGEASDSFKRACVNWGLGRELYTAPFIWIDCDPNEFKFDKLKVSEIDYNDKREIIKLTLVDKRGTVRYSYSNGKTATPKAAPKAAAPKSAPSAPAQPAQPVGDVKPITAAEAAKMYLANNVKAFEWFQEKMYPHNATLEDFTEQELQNIFGLLHSKGKL